MLRRLPIAALALVIAAAPAALAQRRGGGGERRSGPGTGNPDEHLVPWKYLATGGAFVKELLVLYWIPAAAADVERSPLRTSRVLLDDSTSCVGYEIVTPDDAVTIAKLGATGRLPLAVLTDSDGHVLRAVDASRSAAVEKMVSDEFDARGQTMYRNITEARRLAGSGDKQHAVDLYRKVWDERCLFPTVAGEAQRALKALGVVVEDTPAPPPPDPNLTPKPAKHP